MSTMALLTNDMDALGSGAGGGGMQFSEGGFTSPCPCCGGFHANFDSSDFGPLAFLNADDRGGTATNGKPSLTVGDAGVQITRTNQTWATALGTATNVTFAFRSTAPATMPADTTGFTRFTDAQITAALASLQAWSDVANITFTRVNDGDGYSDNATILFGDYATGQNGAAAFAYLPGSRSSSSATGDVWVNYSGTNVSPALLNYGQHTLTHEIGHALGLSHPAAYNAAEGVSITYGNDAIYYEDSRQYTVMSYFSETSTGANYRVAGTGASQYSAVPLLDDIAAAQRLYGANTTTRTGDTVYGFNSNADRAWFTTSSASTSLIFAVWDAGGVDTFDFSGYTQAGTIDLRQGSFSSVGGLTGNIAIAMGVVIENAIGGMGSDRIYGNSADNRLSGGPLGNDVIDGGLGIDTVVFSGVRANYTITWNGQTGTVTANGNPQFTTITNVEFLAFSDQTIAATPTGGLNVSGDTTNDTMNGTAFADTLSGAGGNDVINGLGGNDTLTGGTGNDQISGGDGNDTIVGGSGNDTLDGGDGVDLADYLAATGGVTVSLAAGTATGGAGSDTLTGIENLRGSSFSDTLTGDAGANMIRGGGGSDTIHGGGGNDIIYSGPGGSGGGAPDIVKAQATANGSQGAAVGLDGGFDQLARTDVQASSSTPHATVTATSSGNAEWYSFTATAGASVVIDIDNATFDSVIRIYNSNGDVLATNDDGSTTGDSGNETDSALTFVMPADGVYYVEVTEWVSNTPSLTTHAIPAGQTYTLHVSVPGHSVAALTEIGSTLFGDDGDDQFFNGFNPDGVNDFTSSDTIDGGTGTDTVFYNGQSANYTISTTNDVTTVTDTANGAVDRITNVERLQFNDRVVELGAVSPPTTVNGTSGADTLQGTAGADTMYGFDGNDFIYGYAGNDVLIGGAGNDTMAGGFGDDTYEVTEAGDIVVENGTGQAFDPGEGNDTVFSYVNGYRLANGVEILRLVGGAQVGYGNALANTLVGNALDNTLVGAAGNDTMMGGAGNDAYEVTEAGDVVIENAGEGTDTVYSYIDSYALTANVENLALIGSGRVGYGNALNNTLIGNAVANTLVGGAGNDTMLGGAGNDAYEVTEAGDVVVENAGEGTDTVYSYIDGYVLGANVENLTLAGGTARVGYGNALDNVLSGNALDNTLIGGAGNDTMVGGAGNDFYEVTEAGDVVVEGINQGSDTVYSYLNSYTLTTNVENLYLVGSAVSGVGNSSFNRMVGNGLANTLSGGGGDDVLIGGAGNDTMIGGGGDDAYEVTEAGDVVTEASADGLDTVYSYLNSYTLTANVELLYLVGGARDGIGNGEINRITGNGFDNMLDGGGGDDVLNGGAGVDTLIGGTGDDVLIGGAGNDTMSGGAGNDAYEVTETGDVVTELAGGGTDTVYSYLDAYQLTDNVEVLALAGAGRVALGNAGNNTLIGNAAVNVLNGNAGNDIMTGGGGADTFWHLGPRPATTASPTSRPPAR
jgi:serralysin